MEADHELSGVIADRVYRRFDTWQGDVLFADVPSPVDDRYDILVIDFESNEIAVDIVDNPSSDIPNVLREAFIDADGEWGYHVNHISRLDYEISGKPVYGNVFYEDKKDFENALDQFENLFSEGFSSENLERISEGEMG